MSCIMCGGSIGGPFGPPCSCSEEELARYAAIERKIWLERKCSICEREMQDDPRDERGWRHAVCMANAQKLIDIGYAKGKKAGIDAERNRDPLKDPRTEVEKIAALREEARQEHDREYGMK